MTMTTTTTTSTTNPQEAQGRGNDSIDYFTTIHAMWESMENRMQDLERQLGAMKLVEKKCENNDAELAEVNQKLAEVNQKLAKVNQKLTKVKGNPLCQSATTTASTTNPQEAQGRGEDSIDYFKTSHSMKEFIKQQTLE